MIFEDQIALSQASIRVEVDESQIRCELVGLNGLVEGVVWIEKSKWDSEHFGFGVGKLKLASFNSDVGLKRRCQVFQTLKVQAFSKGMCVIFARIPMSDSLTFRALESEGAILADVLLTFNRDLNDLLPIKRDCMGIELTEASPNDEIELRQIAKEVFRYDHFHRDSRLLKEKCDRLHQDWVSNSLKGLADIVFVAKMANNSVGFITCRILTENGNQKKGVIDLLGVKKECEGSGIGTSLVSRALEWFSNHVVSVRVGTQSANIKAVRLYQRLGFKKVSSNATFHLWIC